MEELTGLEHTVPTAVLPEAEVVARAVQHEDDGGDAVKHLQPLPPLSALSANIIHTAETNICIAGFIKGSSNVHPWDCPHVFSRLQPYDLNTNKKNEVDSRGIMTIKWLAGIAPEVNTADQPNKTPPKFENRRISGSENMNLKLEPTLSTSCSSKHDIHSWDSILVLHLPTPWWLAWLPKQFHIYCYRWVKVRWQKIM